MKKPCAACIEVRDNPVLYPVHVVHRRTARRGCGTFAVRRSVRPATRTGGITAARPRPDIV
jgi:hypothetical protein